MPTIRINLDDIRITDYAQFQKALSRYVPYFQSLTPEEFEAVIKEMMRAPVRVKPFPRDYKPKGSA